MPTYGLQVEITYYFVPGAELASGTSCAAEDCGCDEPTVTIYSCSGSSSPGCNGVAGYLSYSGSLTPYESPRLIVKKDYIEFPAGTYQVAQVCKTITYDNSSVISNPLDCPPCQ